ncbi:MAG: hypothetical protein M3R15_28835 [Acidobacteriota bacterium]|nr:hypothetical protein [Acidobacteriota bacterium]
MIELLEFQITVEQWLKLNKAGLCIRGGRGSARWLAPRTYDLVVVRGWMMQQGAQLLEEMRDDGR